LLFFLVLFWLELREALKLGILLFFYGLQFLLSRLHKELFFVDALISLDAALGKVLV
jgi:hypothetical protein